MNEEFIKSIENICAAIKTAMKNNTSKDLETNYRGGIWHCEKLIEMAKNNEMNYPCDDQIDPFKYYSSDSLPWDDVITEALNNEFSKLYKIHAIKLRA